MRALRGHHLIAWLDEETLESAHPALLIDDIREEIEENTEYEETPLPYGQHFSRFQRKKMKITILFRIWEFEDVQARYAAVEAANQWAKAGWLRLSTRPGKRLFVRCAKSAAIQRPRDYTETLSLELEAAESPFWEEEVPARAAQSGVEATGTIFVPGTEGAAADVTITAGTMGLSWIVLRFGDSAITLLELALSAGEKLLIDHDRHGYLRIRAGNESRLNRRTGDSDDDLVGGPGKTEIGFAADAAATVTWEVRGKWR